jgi:hypothetical protein
VYTLIKTDKDYRVLKDRVIFLSGMQLRFLYDLHENLVPDLDIIFTYFESLDQVTELIHLELITVRPQRTPGTGEKKLILSDYLYYGVRASVFRAELTEDGYNLLKEVMGTEFFCECMEEMDRCMAENLLRGSL